MVLRVWHRWARRHGIDAAVVERTIHGRPVHESIRLLAPGSDVERETQVIDDWELSETDDLSALPGGAELQRLLGDERFAVVTSCSRRLAEIRLRAVELDVPRVLVTREVTSRGKPAPDGYLFASAQLEVAPADCIVIEDSPVGLTAGKAAGMRTIGLTTTFPAGSLDADMVVSTRLRKLST